MPSKSLLEPILAAPFSGEERQSYLINYHWKNWERGTTPFVIIQLTISGSGFFILDHKMYEVPERHAFIAIVPEASEYYLDPQHHKQWVVSWINFYGRFGVELWKQFRTEWGPVISLESDAAIAFHELVRSTQQPMDRFLHSMDCYAFFMKWMRWLSRPSKLSDDPIDIAIRFCQTRFHEPIAIKTLANEVGLSREHFTRLFTTKTGISPALYLRQCRQKAARELLATTTLPQSEIAMRCGLGSVRTLNRLCKPSGDENI